MDDLQSKRDLWHSKVMVVIDRWRNARLGVITVERWESERDHLYMEIKQEMERCGNDMFLPKILKDLVQIRGPSDQIASDRWNRGMEYVRSMAQMNEVEKVLDGLRILSEIDRYLSGPYGYEIRGVESDVGGEGFVVLEADRTVVFGKKR